MAGTTRMHLRSRQGQPSEGSTWRALFDPPNARKEGPRQRKEGPRQKLRKRDQETAWPKIGGSMLRYPVALEKDTNGTIRAIFPNVPEAHTFGEDEDEALMQAADALESALSLYIEDRRDIPAPS